MRGYFAFITENWRLLGFGVLFTFLSSFGQTFFIALFNNDIRDAFGLGHGEFGGLYFAATMLSALTLPWIGRYIDDWHLRSYALMCVITLAAAAALIATSWSVIMLGVALFLVRLSGQGLMSHTAMTAMARCFRNDRGKAVSFAALGHPIGEAVFPMTALAVVALLGDWRLAWMMFSILLVVVAIPMIVGLLQDRRILARTNPRFGRHYDSTITDDGVRSWSRGEVIRDPLFYLVVPVTMAAGFLGTGIIFHHAHILDVRDWGITWFAVGFIGYAACSIVSMLVGGTILDRIGSVRMLTLVPVPVILAFLVLSSDVHPAVVPVFLALSGLAAGLSATLTGAIWAELYGTRHVGSIRSVAISIMVFSTAASPFLFGVLFDAGWPVIGVTGLSLGYMIAAWACAIAAQRMFQRRQSGATPSAMRGAQS